MNSNIAIQCTNISKKYSKNKKYGDLRSTLNNLFQRNKRQDSFWALQDINLTIQKGEVLGIIGKNGAGKSTLLKLLSKITHPTTGTIHIDGRITSLLEVGTGFHPELTGKENIFLNGALLGMKRDEIKQKLDEIIAFSGVEKFINMPVKHYSSGMYVRLAFAVAAHLNTEILVIDEVLAVGDQEFQNKCLGKMEGYADSGRTVLLVSHNLPHISNLCTRAILLESGTLTHKGHPDIVIEKYLNSDKNNTTVNENEIVEITCNKPIHNDTIYSYTGDSLTILIKFLKPYSPGLYMDLIILDNQNIEIFKSTVDYFFPALDIKEGDLFEIDFKELLLNQGRYTFSLRIIDYNLRNLYTKNITIIIEKSNYYGGSTLPHLNNKLLLQHRWKRIK